MKYLVTGGAGFIGSHLVIALCRAGHQVVVLDNLSTGKIENLSSVKEKIDFRLGDIRDLTTVKQLAQGVDVVFHLAALGSVPRSIKDPLLVNEHNVTGTLTVLVAAREAGVRRVVFSSSSSVYGLIKVKQQIETLTPRPVSPYAATKFGGELYTRLAGELYGLETVSLRYFNVFGPRQEPHSQYAAVVPIFITQLLKGKPVLIHGDGQQKRDFTYVENVVQANLAAREAKLKLPGEPINIATGGTVTVMEMYRELEKIFQLKIDPTFGPARAGDIRYSHANIDRAREVLNWTPGKSFRQGLRETAAWYQQAIAKAPLESRERLSS